MLQTLGVSYGCQRLQPELGACSSKHQQLLTLTDHKYIREVVTVSNKQKPLFIYTYDEKQKPTKKKTCLHLVE